MDYERFTRMLIEDMRAHNGEVTNGPMAGRPLMLLTTTGAKTGKERSTIVTYTRDRDRYVIAASKSGAPTNPAWFHNLRANPDTTVQVGSERRAVHARVATPQERERLWPHVIDAYSGYADYQARTGREIPLVILERRGT
jgi:F420H(2)-dependent quinone reductase